MTGALHDPHQASRHQPPSYGEPSLLAEAPALSRSDWLPEGAFPDLDELREEHLRLKAAAVEAGTELDAARERHEQEDADHAAAGRARALGQGVELPELTPPEERAAELAPLQARATAVLEVRNTFLRGAVATITDRYQEWTDELDSRDGDAEARVDAARAALAEAEAAVGQTRSLRHWLDRTAGRHPIFKQIDGRHIAFADLAIPTDADLLATASGGDHA